MKKNYEDEELLKDALYTNYYFNSDKKSQNHFSSHNPNYNEKKFSLNFEKKKIIQNPELKFSGKKNTNFFKKNFDRFFFSEKNISYCDDYSQNSKNDYNEKNKNFTNSENYKNSEFSKKGNNSNCLTNCKNSNINKYKNTNFSKIDKNTNFSKIDKNIISSKINKNKNFSKNHSGPYYYNNNLLKLEPENGQIVKSLKLIFKILIWLILIILPIIFIRDVIKKTKIGIREKQMVKELCFKEYLMNKCENPVPMTEIFCLEKKKCFENNDKNVLILKNFFNVFFEVFNCCLDMISYRSFFLIFVFFCVFALFFNIKKKEEKIKYY